MEPAIYGPVTELRGVGPQLAVKLARLNVTTIQDILFHLPIRYEDRTHITPVGSARPGDTVVVVGEIEMAEAVFRRRRSLLVRFSDGTGAMTMRMFYFSNAQKRAFQKGRWLQCFGEVRRGPATLELIHPEYRVSDERPGRADGADTDTRLSKYGGNWADALAKPDEPGIGESSR